MIEDNQQNQNVDSSGFVDGDAASSKLSLPEDSRITAKMEDFYLLLIKVIIV